MANKYFKIVCVFSFIIIISNYFIEISTKHQLYVDDLNTSSNQEVIFRIKGPMAYDDQNLLQHLREFVLKPPSTMIYNLSTDPLYRSTRHSNTWEFINKALRNLFRNFHKGFYVEAGALDGEYLSNSLWLEQNLSWVGLLVEPEYYNYKDIVLKRRKAWLSHSCLSNEIFPKQVIMVSMRKRKYDIVQSLVVRGSSFQFSYNNYTEIGDISENANSAEPTYYNSQCYPLASSLLALNVTVVDFLSLDLQGAELDVFNTIPLDKFFIRSLVIEDSLMKTNYRLIKHFNKLGFDLLAAAASGPDYFFINRNDSMLMKRGKLLGMAQRFIDQNLVFKYPSLPFGTSYQEIMEIQANLAKIL